MFAAAKEKDVAGQFNLEYRVTDGAASPYMALGALIFAGADGIASKFALPQAKDTPKPLPRSLAEALDGMEGSAAVKDWFGPTFLEAYLRHKRSELGYVQGLEPAELCARYAEVY